MGNTLVDPPHDTIPDTNPPDTEPTVDEPASDLAALEALEPPVPASPTTPDPEPPPAQDHRQKKPSPRSGGRVAAVALSVVLAVLVVAGTALYLFVWRYEPVARRHVPANATLASRLELADVALFGPVRKHLWPSLTGDRSPEEARRMKRMSALTGVNLTTDVREIVIASVDATSWVLVAGGHIRKGQLVSGLAAFAREEGWSGWSVEGDLLRGPSAWVGQADDGAIVIGTSESIVRAALPASDEYRHIGLPEDGAAVVVITRQAFSGVNAMLPMDTPALRQIERASGRLTLGSAPKLTLSLEPAPGVPPATVARDVESLFRALRLAAFLLPDVAGEKGALAAATVKVDGERVLLEAAWPYEGLDRGCAKVAKLLH